MFLIEFADVSYSLSQDICMMCKKTVVGSKYIRCLYFVHIELHLSQTRLRLLGISTRSIFYYDHTELVVSYLETDQGVGFLGPSSSNSAWLSILQAPRRAHRSHGRSGYHCRFPLAGSAL